MRRPQNRLCVCEHIDFRRKTDVVNGALNTSCVRFIPIGAIRLLIQFEHCAAASTVGSVQMYGIRMRTYTQH